MHVQAFGALHDVIFIAGLRQEVCKHLVRTLLTQGHLLLVVNFLYPEKLRVNVFDLP